MKLFALTALAAAALAGAPAFAADFTFDVPVNIENVPSGQNIVVQCFVSTMAAASASGASSVANTVGRGEKSANIVNGTLKGTVTVEVNASGSNPATSAKSFGCSLNIIGKPVNGVSWSASPENAQQVYERATNLRVDRVVTKAYGTLP